MVNMVHKKIVEALYSTVESASLGYDIAYPNVDYTPSTDNVYLRLSPLSVSDQQMHVGANTQTETMYIYQISVISSNDRGLPTLLGIANSIQELFVLGSTITQNDITIRVTSPATIAPPIYAEKNINIPVSVRVSTYNLIN